MNPQNIQQIFLNLPLLLKKHNQSQKNKKEQKWTTKKTPNSSFGKLQLDGMQMRWSGKPEVNLILVVVEKTDPDTGHVVSLGWKGGRYRKWDSSPSFIWPLPSFPAPSPPALILFPSQIKELLSSLATECQETSSLDCSLYFNTDSLLGTVSKDRDNW